MRLLSQCCFIFTASLFSLNSLTNPLVATQSNVEITTPDGTSTWAMQEKTGRIFAAVKSANAVVEFDTSGKKVREFNVELEPTELVIKNDRLIVACEKPTCYTIINLAKNQVAGKIALNGAGPYGLFCSKAENNFVYGFCEKENGAWKVEIHQIDVSNLKVVNKSTLQDWDDRTPTKCRNVFRWQLDCG